MGKKCKTEVPENLVNAFCLERAKNLETKECLRKYELLKKHLKVKCYVDDDTGIILDNIIYLKIDQGDPDYDELIGIASGKEV